MPGFDRLLKGILKYRLNERANVLKQLNNIKENHPISIIFSCMDRRVVSTKFFQSDLGDHFIVKNAGNFVPHAKQLTYEAAATEPGALELGCGKEGVKHVVVCGHSDCRAMGLLYSLRNELGDTTGTPLELWVKRQGSRSIQKFKHLTAENGFTGPVPYKLESEYDISKAYIDKRHVLSMVDKLSQVNCIQQLENISSYAFMKDKLSRKEVHLHVVWFHLDTASVFMLCRHREEFIEVNEDNYDILLEEAEG